MEFYLNNCLSVTTLNTQEKRKGDSEKCENNNSEMISQVNISKHISKCDEILWKIKPSRSLKKPGIIILFLNFVYKSFVYGNEFKNDLRNFNVVIYLKK